MTQADLTRERLVRAALELFTARGYHETTTPQIAKQAGVAEGTIYRHFTSKQHCFNELFRTAARWAGQLIKDVDALKVGPREKLAELARGLVTGAAHVAPSRGCSSSSATRICWTTRVARPRATSASASRA